MFDMSEFQVFFMFGIVVLIAWVIKTYNKFVKFQNMIEEGWSIIDVALKRRANLIPQLISTVEGYSDHETDTLKEVIERRGSEGRSDKRLEEEGSLSRSLGGLLAVAEAYPDLKANTTFIELQNALNEVEREIADARNTFNQRVRVLNTLIDQFPSNFIANFFKFGREGYFKLSLATEREVTSMPWDKK